MLAALDRGYLPGSLHLGRAPLLEATPIAPLVADIRLSVTAVSYAGVLSIALLADESVTNLPAMAAGMRSVLGLPTNTPVSQPPHSSEH
jgi:WS/DGAT C-terminal domain